MNPGKILITVIAALLSGPLHAEVLLDTTTTWEGAEITYPKGQPHVTSVKVKIDAGKATAFHCHPVLTLGYVLKGRLEVETKDGKKKILGEGESVAEVFRTVHRGIALDGDVEILVFYVGDTETPNTVYPENDKEHKYCK